MIEHIVRFIVPAAYALLPAQMASPEATAMTLAIGLQESLFQYRRQINGPARGLYQFEVGGVRAVLKHERTTGPIVQVIRALQYDPSDASVLQLAIEHNDVLATAFARCLLYVSSRPLVGPGEMEAAWLLYMDTWRPGKPRRESWDGNFNEAWALVLGGRESLPTMKA